jgi:hypothetical protein
MKEKIPSILVGVAGEYFVAAELSRRGYIASISMRNTKGIDILATNASAKRSVTIQCKTNQDGSSSWLLNKKAETVISLNHFYVFVAIGSLEETPRFHVVPSHRVARDIKIHHRECLQRGGEDNPIRKFNDPEGSFVDRWDILKLET